MSTAKFEKLIDLIINEDQERAEQLFHEIVVEKSREIYEGLMELDMEEGDMVGELVDEISDESVGTEGMMETDEEMDAEPEMDAEVDDEVEVDMDAEPEMDADMDADEEESEPATKDDIMNLEDKLDELMAEFEALMHDDADEEEAEGEEEGEEEAEGEEEEESGVMESVQLQAAPKPKHEDHKATSPVTANSGGKGVGGDRKPVNFAGGSAESGGKVSAPKEMGMKFKNAPGGGKGVGDGKGESAPKPTSEDPGKSKSPVAESKKIVKKIVK